jgi:RNA chaperone Hfq
MMLSPKSNALRPPLEKARPALPDNQRATMAVIKTPDEPKPKVPPPPPPSSLPPERPEPDVLMFQKALREKRLLRLRLLNGFELVGRLIAWGRFSILLMDPDGGGERCVFKHAISSIKLGEKLPLPPPDKGEADEQEAR